ncbi:hypothetical protein DL766_004076 [Monosporascus sp. MC13-8B]|uniref:Ribosomal RNA-processing protein 42 n=1 Tax=Monosporascus cannonballus TaxID=155416 RepID=A0ABY0HBJ2_9PEZI|nr:hypothetical protein DL762_003109 [Monosporascus cannonballus]RYO99113.1 hypothetical protein DL763_001714 [Monosporascus cannonballus]RYP32236.1 hypothetical protein DL766_004076 [Monosporascus sp. MC13-8B]
MATSQHLLLSPAELAYLHSSLRLSPPVRPDGRTAAQFRPLVAETGILPGTNGSARVCFADGTEAIVGVKAEVEKTRLSPHHPDADLLVDGGQRSRRKKRGTRKVVAAGREEDGGDSQAEASEEEQAGKMEEEEEGEGTVSRPDAGDNDWVEMTVEIPGYRDDESSTVFLATMLSEALLADGKFTKKLWINRRFHWKLYLDVSTYIYTSFLAPAFREHELPQANFRALRIILISPPLSYPLPLLSLTTHLALLSTRLPKLKSEAEEDPMFDDDWAASTFIYPQRSSKTSPPPLSDGGSRPPVTLLVVSVGDNIIFDPSKEELAVADSALAVSVGEVGANKSVDEGVELMDVDEVGPGKGGRNLRLLSVRTIDPPSRLTAPGVPNAINAAVWGHGALPAKDPGAMAAETENVEGVWKAPRGGTKIGVLNAMVARVLEKGGIAEEVLEALDAVELG